MIPLASGPAGLQMITFAPSTPRNPWQAAVSSGCRGPPAADRGLTVPHQHPRHRPELLQRGSSGSTTDPRIYYRPPRGWRRHAGGRSAANAFLTVSCVTSGHQLHASAFKRTLAWASIANGRRIHT